MCRRRTLGYNAFEMSPILFRYTGNYQTFIVPRRGFYRIECWGASGDEVTSISNKVGGGAYVAGSIYLAKGEILYIQVGNGGRIIAPNAVENYNGGGLGSGYRNTSETWRDCGCGGGATDVRLISGLWDNMDSLRSRIIVAGGGAYGTYGTNVSQQGPRTPLGCAGGLKGYDEGSTVSSYVGVIPTVRGGGGTQTSGGTGAKFSTTGNPGSFGRGGNANTGVLDLAGGGAGGYYGGGAGATGGDYIGSGGGGSSFISGHAGCNAINSSGVHTGQPNHYSGKVFQDTIMIDGAGYQWTSVKGLLLLMPKPMGGTYASGIGHHGAGFCKISKAI